ncbi:HAD family hydrolase [Candidatus Poribacteria bacterium]|nr:HAD family hydrolase [Candidatus Poribacteria bacterium]
MSETRRAAAFFDVDGTLLDTNIVLFYVHYKTHGMSPARRWFWLAGFLRRVPILLLADKVSRAGFNRLFYQMYQSMDAEEVKRLADDTFPTFAKPRFYAEGLATVREHQRRGDPVVLVTGTADFIAAPIARHIGADDVRAARLEERNGVFTGSLIGEPLSDERKADAVRRYAVEHDLRLEDCAAYGDSSADAAMLSVVGHPVAVNPSRGLRRTAHQKGWRIAEWK